MTKPVFSLNFLAYRHRFFFNAGLSQCATSHKRCFSTKDDSNTGDHILKQDSKDSATVQSSESKTKTQILSKEDSKAAAKKKLLSLLSELTVVSDDPKRSSLNLNLARAEKRPSKKERLKDILEQRPKTPHEELQSAAKAVADTVKGDPQQTLLELNEKLGALNLAKGTPKTFEEIEDPKALEGMKDIVLDDESSKNIMSSVEEVAATVTDNAAPIKSQLTERLLRLSVDRKSTTPRTSIDDLVKGMKVERGGVQTQMRRQEHFDRSAPSQKRSQPPRQMLQTKFNIFQASPLDLFPIQEEAKVDTKKRVWQSLEENNLKLLVQFAPTNAFEEMIIWTEQGKHWKFPIDNETEMGEEEKVGFHEHVFLDQHLHGFPTKGPIRHFMELVVVGLSKNPYITVERKIENIDWFRDYFKEKEDILRETGVLG